MAANQFESGIYEIRNVVNGKVYIGSAKRFNFRWNTHKSFLRKGNHHCQHLQAAWNKHGESSFSFKKLLICSVANLVMYEQLMIDGHHAADRQHGYNARPAAESMLGYKHTPAAKLKMVAAGTGRKASPETRALLSRQRVGRKMPDWFPGFTRAHKTGTKHSDATKAIISAKGVGRPRHLKSRELFSKVTFEQVAEIKIRAASGATQTQIANEFSLSQSAVSLIVNGKRWANLLPTSQEN